MKNQPFHKRLGYSISGIVAAWKGEASFRFQCLAALGVCFLLALLRATPLWWAVVLLTVGAILSAELMNTALEHVVDRLHPEQHPTIKLAKDCAAGAVLILSLMSLGVFAAFLYDRFTEGY